MRRTRYLPVFVTMKPCKKKISQVNGDLFLEGGNGQQTN